MGFSNEQKLIIKAKYIWEIKPVYGRRAQLCDLFIFKGLVLKLTLVQFAVYVLLELEIIGGT